MQATQTPATTSVLGTVTPDQLRTLADDLAAQYPEAGARVDHALFLLIARRVERSDSGNGWWVGSEREAEKEYMVLDREQTCTCQDWQRHASLSPCKHQLAVRLYQRAERQDAEQTDPTPETVEVNGVDVAGQPIRFEVTPQGWAIIRPTAPRGITVLSQAERVKQLNDELFADAD